MKKQITNNQSVKKIENYDKAKTLEFINKMAKADCDPERLYEDLGKLLPAYIDGTEKEREKLNTELNDKVYNALIMLGTENNYPLAEIVNKKYRPLLLKTCEDVCKEYDCKTTSEKMLAQMVASSYAKIIQISSSFNTYSEMELLSGIKNGYYEMLNKALDKSHRQLISALSTLKQIKSPTLDISIKANTAFVSQNQQINSVNKNEEIKKTV